MKETKRKRIDFFARSLHFLRSFAPFLCSHVPTFPRTPPAALLRSHTRRVLSHVLPVLPVLSAPPRSHRAAPVLSVPPAAVPASLLLPPSDCTPKIQLKCRLVAVPPYLLIDCEAKRKSKDYHKPAKAVAWYNIEIRAAQLENLLMSCSATKQNHAKNISQAKTVATVFPRKIFSPFTSEKILSGRIAKYFSFALVAHKLKHFAHPTSTIFNAN